jgi:hypothetical protein
MRDLWEDMKTLAKFFSWGFIKGIFRTPSTAFLLVILWGAGVLRDISKLGLKNCDD